MELVETPDERQARQFAQLRSLGKLAMAIAEASGAQTVTDLEHPKTPSRAAAIFARAVSAIRQIIALELRVETGRLKSAAAPAAAGLRPIPPPDPRRPLLREVLHDAVRNHTERARRRTIIDQHIDQELLADPADQKPIANMLETISRALDIHIESARLPDAFLDYNETIKLARFRDRPREPSA